MKHGKSGFVGAHGGSGFVAQLLAAGSTLLDGLVSYWTLDETSGVRYDSVGVNDLTDNNTVGAVLRGPEGTVASLVAANNEGLYIPAPGIVLPPQGTVTIWAKVDPAASDGWHSQLIFYNYVLLQCYVSGGKVVFVSGTFYDGNAYQGAGSAWGETYIGDGSGWFLLTVTWDGSTYRVYPNSGANVWSVAGGSPLHDPNQASWISFPAQNWDGELAGCGLWSRAISQEEVATLFASGNGLRYADLPAGLKTGLVSWWELDETSGVRYDSHGSNDLTDNNTVGSVINAGDAMDGAAASFVAANSESLSKASFVAPDDYAISLWMKPTAAAIAAGTTHFFDCGAAWPTNVQFALAMAGAAIRVTISDGSGYVQKDGLGTLVAGEWTHLIVVYDSATKKASIYMDNDSGAVSDALAGSADRTSATLYVGKFVDGGGSYVYDGILDEVAIWSRVLTEDERASLFNRGNGKTYEDLTAAEKTGLVSYWKLDETSGVRYDSHGSNDLTDNNTVLSAPASAVKFTASNQELRITPYGDVDLSATGFTVAGWFYTANGFPTVSYDDGSANRVFLWIGANFYVLDSAGGFQGVTVDPPYPRWSHVILSYDPADKKGYAWINGALKGSTPVLTNGLAYKPNAPFYFGHGGTDGGASEVGFWNRLLTSDERAALAATVHTYDDLSAALKTGLMSWWPLGGGGADVHGGKNLNPSNGPTFQLAAMDGGAASFVAANSETLTKATAVIDTSADWTAAMWVRLDVAGYGRPITAVTSPHLHAGLLYESQYSGSFNRLYNNYNYGVDPIDLGNNLGEWVLLFLEYNKATTTMRHCGYGTASNNGVWSTGTVAELPAMPDFRLGQETTGLIDEVALWSRVLTDDERAELYAAGAGKFYPFEG